MFNHMDQCSASLTRWCLSLARLLRSKARHARIRSLRSSYWLLALVCTKTSEMPRRVIANEVGNALLLSMQFYDVQYRSRVRIWAIVSMLFRSAHCGQSMTSEARRQQLIVESSQWPYISYLLKYYIQCIRSLFAQVVSALST